MEAVRKEVRPYIYWLGFQIDRRPKEERSWCSVKGTLWRQRGTYIDELDIGWEKYGRPRFSINFWTSQEERMAVVDRYNKYKGVSTGAIYPHKISWSGGWYGGRMPVDKTIRVAKARLAELDIFLKTGAPTTYLSPWKNQFRKPNLK